VSTISRSAQAIRVRRLAQSPVARDATVAAVALALTLGMLSHSSGASRGLDALGVLLAATACLPLLARRRAPLQVFAVCTAASAITEGLGFALGPPIGATVALFYVAADRRTPERMRQTAIIVIGLGAVHIAVAAGAESGFPTVAVLGAIIIWGGAWIIGDQLRQRRQRLSDLTERAQRAERETERERRLAAAEERTRIARDLHDSAAHAINVILVQAGGARLLQDRDPNAVRGALETIENVARETIGEIDQLIGALRTDGDGDGRRAASGAGIELPTGLASAESLAARYRTAGLAVAIDVDGHGRSLAPGLDQAAYRILQESLTNAARHGTGGADVQITYADEHLELTVSNPIGPERDGERTTSSYGVLGMRERAALLGGTLDADASRGVFRVHARLPYQPVHTTVA
jgi:signal transduction histidine kinase